MKTSIAGLLLSVALLLNSTFCRATNLQFTGTGSYQINGSQVTVTFDELDNIDTNRSGTIYLKLMAMQADSPSGSGYVLGEVNLSTVPGNVNNGTLDPGASYTNITFTSAYTPPPDGTYYVYLLAFEYPNLNTYLASVPATNNPHQFSSGGSGGTTTSGTTSGTNGLSIKCPCAYDVNGGQIILQAAEIDNASSLDSGTLKLKLIATTSPYSGGTKYGYDIGEDDLGVLYANHYFYVNQSVPYTSPPTGTYYLTMILTEYTGQDTIMDYIPFNGTVSITDSSSSGGGGSGSSGGGSGGGGAISPLGLFGLGLLVWLRILIRRRRNKHPYRQTEVSYRL